MDVPTVTQDTAAEDATRPSAPDPVARIRRLLASTPSGSTDPGSTLLAAALARFDAPADLRVRGGLGSGRRTLATALRARRGWRVTVEDLDVVAAPGEPPAPAPDVEIICLRTAPCRHEEAWVRRPRRHPMLIVATGLDPVEGVNENKQDEKKQDDDDETSGTTGTGAHTRVGPARPRWARGLPAVDARSPEDRSVDTVVSFVERALDVLPAVRVARLEAELERLAVHPEIGELAEAALCALDQP